jgi:translation initiation factor 2 beta subunit (eIF-2beta)/eIF-5
MTKSNQPAPICAEWRYISLVKVCPICGAPGKNQELMSAARLNVGKESNRQEASISFYCRVLVQCKQGGSTGPTRGRRSRFSFFLETRRRIHWR